MNAVQQAYDEQGELAKTKPQPGSELTQKRQLGEGLALGANGLFIGTGVAALVTTVAAVFFTDWQGRADAEADEETETGPPESAPAPADKVAVAR
jgi:hypothetical protein